MIYIFLSHNITHRHTIDAFKYFNNPMNTCEIKHFILQDYSKLLLCRPYLPPPPSQNRSYLHEKMCTMLNRIKNQFSVFWPMNDCIFNLRRHTSLFYCVTDQKKSFISGQIYRKDAQWAEIDYISKTKICNVPENCFFISFSSLRIFPVNLASFERYFLVGDTVESEVCRHKL